MIALADFFHYSTIALLVCVSAIGVGLGQGLIGIDALQAMHIQPQAAGAITRLCVLGMALLEFAAISGLTLAMFLLFSSSTITLYTGIAELGIAAALAITGLVIGFASYFPASRACRSLARQPFFAQQILRFMLLSQSIIQTPIVFGFIIAMFIKMQVANATNLADALRLLAGGLCIGIGSIGPALGLAHFAKTACESVGVNRQAYPKLLSFTFISQAIIETPILFALLLSLIILSSSANDNMLHAIAMISAALCIGIGTFGPGFSSGRIAAAACQEIALAPENHSYLSRVSMFGQGLVDTGAIYAFLIAILIYFFR
ncbi:MAG: hypothetical protein M1114_06130 [Candidatus Dependentiae bacterium]|nr:hypothetical protein [Candidatus Dependentiae bacterium]